MSWTVGNGNHSLVGNNNKIMSHVYNNNVTVLNPAIISRQKMDTMGTLDTSTTVGRSGIGLVETPQVGNDMVGYVNGTIMDNMLLRPLLAWRDRRWILCFR